jgi:hypothetical protein
VTDVERHAEAQAFLALARLCVAEAARLLGERSAAFSAA